MDHANLLFMQRADLISSKNTLVALDA